MNIAVELLQKLEEKLSNVISPERKTDIFELLLTSEMHLREVSDDDATRAFRKYELLKDLLEDKTVFSDDDMAVIHKELALLRTIIRSAISHVEERSLGVNR